MILAVCVQDCRSINVLDVLVILPVKYFIEHYLFHLIALLEASQMNIFSYFIFDGHWAQGVQSLNIFYVFQLI